ncbi:MAG TPA: pantothenate kinase, partial [Alphaproteobacteria bacterium]|nr:pantothenate kinase [Alphaproteobacteria bacterium]
NITPKNIQKIIVSSVVPQVKYEFTKFCKEYLNKKPVFISDIKDKLKLKIRIEKPEELGADRIVNSLAAQHIYKRTPLVIIDLGTATTFDVVDKNGGYIGGIIAPGINLSLDALQKAAAKLPKITVTKTKNIIGKNTVTAMQSGI